MDNEAAIIPSDNSPPVQEGAKASKENAGEDDAKIFSLYVRPSSRHRLGIVKKWLDLSYSDTLDLLLAHIIEENILPEEAVAELKESGLLKNADTEEMALLGINTQWPKAAKLITDIEGTNKEISAQLEELMSCIEDHAEAIILHDQQ